MKKILLGIAVFFTTAILCIVSAGAETYGDYTYTVLGDGTVEITDYNGKLYAGLVIPSELDGKKVTSIGEAAFESAEITSVTIPDGVTSIGDKAFRYCISLETVSIPDSVKTIGDYAFNECGSLTLINIPQGVTSIGDYAFWYCQDLASIEFPASVTSIGEDAFAECYALEEIVVASANKNYASADGVLFNKNLTELIMYPSAKADTSYIVPSTVTKLGGYAFADCMSLTSITLPEGLTQIGHYAFPWCGNLKTITIPKKVTTIDDYAFWYDGSLTDIKVDADNKNYVSVDGVLFSKDMTEIVAYPSGKTASSYDIPDGVKTIANGAFTNATEIETITIPAGVTSIGDFAFSDCIALKTITIPDGVISMGDYAFAWCYELKSADISDSVKSIGEYCFDWCYSLETANIPRSITVIEDFTFGNCNSLKSIVIPDGVTSIGAYSFNSCYGLTSIVIPDSVASIGEYAFLECENAVIKCYENSVAHQFAVENNIDYELIPDELTPTVVSATPGDKQVTLNWTAVEGASYYQIIRYNKGTYSLIANINGTSAVVKGLTNNFEYTYLIKAVAADGRTSLSNAVNVTPVAELAKPTLSATADDKQATLSWNAIEGASYYQIIRYNKGTYSLIANISGTSAIVKGLTNNFEYTYLIKAVAADGRTSLSNAVNVTPVAALAKPTLSAVAGDKQATLSWTAVYGASYYQIIRYNKGTYSLIANISGTSAIVKGLTNNFEYTYLIKAVAADGRTSLSNAANVTPVAALAKPTLSAVAGDKQATLSWTAVDGASYYQIIRYNKGAYSLVANIGGTSAVVKGLTNNFEYTYLVKAVLSDGTVVYSNSVNITPMA